MAFVFSGSSAVSPAIAATLSERSAVFRHAMKQCDDAVRRHSDESLLDHLAATDPSAPLQDSALTPVATFALQYGLSALLSDWGIRAEGVVGHGVGEFAAACYGDVLDLDSTVRGLLRLGAVTRRARGAGEMLALSLDEAEALELIATLSLPVSLAAINGPHSVVVSGKLEAVGALEAELRQRDIQYRSLQVGGPSTVRTSSRYESLY
ncbi:MAG: acyltransferase domain-containing protein [Pseudomonadota bacterium]